MMRSRRPPSGFTTGCKSAPTPQSGTSSATCCPYVPARAVGAGQQFKLRHIGNQSLKHLGKGAEHVVHPRSVSGRQ
jgi:hypothetical protein